MKKKRNWGVTESRENDPDKIKKKPLLRGGGKREGNKLIEAESNFWKKDNKGKGSTRDLAFLQTGRRRGSIHQTGE